MSVEIKQINTTVGTSISKLWQVPLSITATGSVITVCPTDAEVFVTYGKLSSFPRRRTKLCPGYVLKFENSTVVQAQHLNIGKWEVLGTLFPLVASMNPSPITVRYDSESSSFIASAPCYGVIVVKSYEYTVAEYDYSPIATVWDDKSNVSTGVAYARVIPKNGTMNFQKMPTIKSCDIPIAGITDSFERYRINLQTVITDKGEWHMPKDFDKDSYDPANAYGAGKEGPSKDNGWVRKNVPLEIGHVGINGTDTKFTRNPMPKLLGGIETTTTAGATIVKPAVDLVMELPKERPLEWDVPKNKGDLDPWNEAGKLAVERSDGKYNKGKLYSDINVVTADVTYVPVPAPIPEPDPPPDTTTA